MATSRVLPLGMARALVAAPVPRPPQPTKATWTVLFSPACTCGKVTPASAEAVATWPDFWISSRRDRPPLLLSVTIKTPSRVTGANKSRRYRRHGVGFNFHHHYRLTRRAQGQFPTNRAASTSWMEGPTVGKIREIS